MSTEEIIKNFRKERAYALGFAEGVMHAVWVLNNCIKAAIPGSHTFENGAIDGESGPKLVGPGCNKIPDILKDVLGNKTIELPIDIKIEINQSQFMKKFREVLEKNKK